MRGKKITRAPRKKQPAQVRAAVLRAYRSTVFAADPLAIEKLREKIQTLEEELATFSARGIGERRRLLHVKMRMALERRMRELERARAQSGAPIGERAGVRVETRGDFICLFYERGASKSTRRNLSRRGFRWSPIVNGFRIRVSDDAWAKVRNMVGRPPSQTRQFPADPRSRPPEKDRVSAIARIVSLLLDDVSAAVERGELARGSYRAEHETFVSGATITIVASDFSFRVLNAAAFFIEPGLSTMTFNRGALRDRFTPEAREVEARLLALVDARRDLAMFSASVRLESNRGEWEAIEARLITARASR